METVALRLYGKGDLRLETFELPAVCPDEILVDVTTNSICMSSYKAALQGADHKRVPADVAENPVIVGHEFSGTILDVGKKHAGTFRPGQRYSIQPALFYPGREHEAPGYSFPYCGGHATHNIIPREVLEMNCLLHFEGEGFFQASLSEPLSCIVGAFKTSYHHKIGEYGHAQGIVERGAMAILGGAGPMGLAAIDYALHGPRQPRRLVVTDVDSTRLARAARILPVQEAASRGVALDYLNGPSTPDLLAWNDGNPYDDIFVFVPVTALIEQAGQLLAAGGCLNFFAGPTDPAFSAPVNFYDIHYNAHHIVGSSGGNKDDMVDALALMTQGGVNPAVLITHVGGISSSARTILNLPDLPGGKKLIYTHKDFPLTALDEFETAGESNPFFQRLAEITSRNRGLWSVEAEQWVLENAPDYREP